MRILIVRLYGGRCHKMNLFQYQVPNLIQVHCLKDAYLSHVVKKQLINVEKRNQKCVSFGMDW